MIVCLKLEKLIVYNIKMKRKEDTFGPILYKEENDINYVLTCTTHLS